MTGLRIAGLFEGYGGLTEATRSVLGGELTWYSEYEPATKSNPKPTQAAARLLAHHNPVIPNLGDITAIDWDTAPRVDILTGGFPCQDVSLAGQRKGIRPDSRSGLWTHMAYGIDRLRPSLVVIENVRGLLSADAACDLEPCPWCVGDDEGRPLRALGAVLGDLADLGYDARWCGLRAADVGAPHGRFRVFVVAWPAADTDRAAVRQQPVAVTWGSGAAVAGQPRDLATADTANDGRREGWPEPAPAGTTGRPGLLAADPDGSGLQGCGGPGRGGPTAFGDGAPAAPDSDGAGRERPPANGGARGTTQGPQPSIVGIGGRGSAAAADTSVLAWGPYEPAVRRWELILGRPAPAPTQTGARGGQQLSPRFVEWMMGLTEGHVTGVPGLSRNEQLKLLGNGVVPQQAGAALRHLLGESVVGVAA